MTCNLCEQQKNIVYEDDVLCVIHAGEASKGHLRVYPKAHLTRLDDVSDALFEHLSFTANYASAVLFELLGAQGTNVLLTEDGTHLAIDVIERVEGDTLNFLWKPKKATSEELDKIAVKIKDKIVIGKATKNEVIIMDRKPEQVVHDSSDKGDQASNDAKINYLLKQLDRLP